jgi:hypothetical protein
MRRVLLLAAGLTVAGASTARAQGPNPGLAADAYAANAKHNAELMQKYTWKMRVQLTYKGEEKPASLYQMNYVNGQLQKTLLSAPPQESGRKHGIKHRIKEEKAEEFKAWAGQLTDLIKRYMAPSPGTMMDFYSRATFSPVPSGKVRATDVGFIQPGDTATYWINMQTKKPTRYAFSTSLQGDPVNTTVTFGQVPGGPQYASQINVSVPTRQVSATVTNFNFELNQ